MSEIIIIAAVSENNVIGNKGTIPWNIPEDTQHFRETTKGYPCIMGSKTYESLPKRPLPNRENIIISRDINYKAEGAIVKHSLEEAIRYGINLNKGKVFLCGGSTIYQLGLQFANTIDLTRIHKRYEGDTFFPKINLSEWEIVKQENKGDFSFIIYKRKI